MTTSVKISAGILFVVLLGVGGFTAYKVLSTAVDNTNYLLKGDQYLSQQQYSNALTSYQKYEVKNPNDLSTYQKIAKIDELKNRFKDAIDSLKKGIDRSPTSGDLNFELGEDQSNLSATDTAYLQQSIDSYLLAAKSEKYKNIGTYKAARLFSQKADAVSLAKAKDLYISLGSFQPAKYELVLYNLNDPDKALSDLNVAQGIPVVSGQEDISTDFSSWSEFAKELSTQLNSVKQDINAKRSSATIDDSKGYVAYKLNRCEFGTEFLKAAIIESEKDVFYPQARLVLGECEKRLKQYSDAKAYVEPVLQKNSTSLDARLILRQIYKGLGDFVNMKKMYDELISLDGQNFGTRLDYAQDLEFIQDYAGAAVQYAWLGQNLNEQSIVAGSKNTNFSLNQKYLIRSYELFGYKANDYIKATEVIQTAIASNVKYIDTNISNELIAWANYQKNNSDKGLRDQALIQAKNLQNTDALYHVAVISKDTGDLLTAKSDALKAYDTDDTGYIAPLAAAIVNETVK